MKRPTITDIAREAGVSKGAVSYALNGRPGVSEATRRRITEIARELGWAPSSTARALSGGRSGAIGLVLDRSLEEFVPALLDGFQGELLLQVAPGRDAALASYRRWRAERKVDGVLLTEPGCAAELVRIGLPAVVLGGPGGVPGVPSVLVDDVAGAAEALAYLAALGHRHVVRIAGAAVFADPEARGRAFTTAATGLPHPGTVHPEPSADAVRRVLTSCPRPTALLCDTDDLAVAALVAARELGLAVPKDLSVVSWDDTPLCRLVRPALTAIRRPLAELGTLAAAVLHDVLAGERPGDVYTSRPRLLTRGSTGPANA
ncbi:LacI family DNA-binding transcriptional regulator [Amycolatopsis sp. cmx-4-61]|uniref:LacI family DNA-binding transcriptional regulator n=1 Tax=Amycolatopsis sp. cmx-4-61 TaxID=2790937 RepID=UPI00397A347F